MGQVRMFEMARGGEKRRVELQVEALRAGFGPGRGRTVARIPFAFERREGL